MSGLFDQAQENSSKFGVLEGTRSGGDQLFEGSAFRRGFSSASGPGLTGPGTFDPDRYLSDASYRPQSSTAPRMSQDLDPSRFHNGIRNGYFDQVAAATTGIANVVAEQLLSHPCLVLRRQCQVNAEGQSFHKTPFTLLPVAYTLQSNQGFWTLWKGIGASIIAKGLTAGVEILIGETFGLPRFFRVIVEESKLEKIMHHVLLKMLSFATTTPFAVAAFVETVRSDTASDCPSMLDCVTNGFARLRYDVFGPRDNSKRFSIFYLVGPSVAHRFSHYFIAELAYNAMYRLGRRHVRKNARNRTMFDDYYPAMFARLMSGLVADCVLFPCELVLHRLYLQGTRTIIDSLDTGLSVVAVSTKYQGVVHCFSTILQNDGFFGLYKGFGALALQYLLHFMVMRVTRTICDHVEEFMAERRPPTPPLPSADQPFVHPSLAAVDPSLARFRDLPFDSIASLRADF